jgi:hypothetical protein
MPPVESTQSLDLVGVKIHAPMQHTDDRDGLPRIVYAIEHEIGMRNVRAQVRSQFVPLATGARKCCQDVKHVAEVAEKTVVTARVPLRVPVRDVNEIVLSVGAEFDRERAGWLQARRTFRSWAR